MKIKYSKKRIKVNLGYGIIMIVIGLFAVYENRFSVFSYLWILLGFIQTGTVLYEMTNQYLTIENNKLTKHSLIPKTIEINEIRKIRKFANSYKIETSEKTLKIDKNIIENDSLFKLEDFFNNLKLKV